MRSLLVSLLLISACVIDREPDIDEPVGPGDESKADGAFARHYLLLGSVDPDRPGATMMRAGGGELRCPDHVVREVCEISDADLVLAENLNATPAQIIDELADTPMIARGRLATLDDRVVLRASAVTRGITSVQPLTPCYRLRPLQSPNPCPPDAAPACVMRRLERLDSPQALEVTTLFFDDVDPTPDAWGQPTPAVQAKIDAGLALAATRPVYTCGILDERDTGDLFWATQLFVPKT